MTRNKLTVLWNGRRLQDGEIEICLMKITTAMTTKAIETKIEIDKRTTTVMRRKI